MTVFLSLLCFLILVLVVQVRFVLRKRKFITQSWEGMLSRVDEVDLAGLQEIAELYLKPGRDQLPLELYEMWKTVGGLRGLQRLRSNADAMLTMAMFAERWNTETGRVVSEFMRSDAVRLRKAILKVELSLLYGFGNVRAPFALQEAIATYILMRGRLLGLYGVAHVGMIPLLEAAL